MELKLPGNSERILQLTWAEFERSYQQLVATRLTVTSLEPWLHDWSTLAEIVSEQYNRLVVATTLDVTDRDAKDRYQMYLDTTFLQSRSYEQKLKEKLLNSGFIPMGMEVVIRCIRAEVELYQESNLLLLAEEQRLCNEHDRIVGAQTVMWGGEERTFMQMYQLLVEEKDRSIRKKAWEKMQERILVDKDGVHELWRTLFDLRRQIAANAGEKDYRAYIWKQRFRFDYTPEDCKAFHKAIENVVVPAVTPVYQRRCKRMGIASCRPWDEFVDAQGRLPLRPYKNIGQLISGAQRIFDCVDPVLGRYFQTMADENLLDLADRRKKAGSSYCTFYEYVHRPFIFMSVGGGHYDMQTLLHESGHAFHGFETAHLPYIMQRNVPMEFVEVASIGMELLGMSCLAESGLYSATDAARAGVETLLEMLKYWPYIAVVDAFQHWMYENPHEGRDPKKCDAKWNELHNRYIPNIDYCDLEMYQPLEWHRSGHIFLFPFYFIEYGLAQLGAVQIWANAQRDWATAIRSYRRALTLGATVTVPDLYQAAGARFSFDPKTLQQAVNIIEEKVALMEKSVQ
jgi:oligoendopeptidase F